MSAGFWLVHRIAIRYFVPDSAIIAVVVTIGIVPVVACWRRDGRSGIMRGLALGVAGMIALIACLIVFWILQNSSGFKFG